MRLQSAILVAQIKEFVLPESRLSVVGPDAEKALLENLCISLAFASSVHFVPISSLFLNRLVVPKRSGPR